jgi:hypothetical protein
MNATRCRGYVNRAGENPAAAARTNGGKMAMKKRQFPKEIFVANAPLDRDDVCLFAYESLAEIDADQDGNTIGIYELKAIQKFRIQRVLEF